MIRQPKELLQATKPEGCDSFRNKADTESGSNKTILRSESMKIEFDFLGNTIPTQLCLSVDDTKVYYKRLNESFGYDFTIYDSEERAMQIVTEIVSVMESQSYDHGAEWLHTNIEIISKDREVYEPCVVRAHFRIRDSY